MSERETLSPHHASPLKPEPSTQTPEKKAWETFPHKALSGKPFISLTGPSQRTTPGNPVPFNCTAGPFSSWDFNVTWMKGRDEHPASAQHLVTNDKGNYFVTSKVWVTLARQDILLGITCEVTHRTLEEPLRKTMNLSQVLQVGPTLKITTKPSGTHTHVHQRVNLTCHASHFYPSHLRLTWMENRHKVQTVESPQVSRNPDGTYSLEHTWQAEATLEGSEFACWVVQDEQPPVQANITLIVAHAAPRKGWIAHSYSLQGPLQRSEPGASIQLTYTSSGFPSRQVTVTWLKKNLALPAWQTHVHASGDTYNVTSRVLVPLQADDVLSFVQCHVNHKSTPVFQKTIGLDQYLRVPPTVTVSQSSPSSDLVAITCHVQRFYPQSVHLTWIENCHIFKGAEELTSKQNSDGTYTLESLHLVNVSGQVSERVLTCKVQHEAQSPIQANLILPTAAHGIYKPIGSSGMPVLIFVAFLLGFKVLLVMSSIVAYICRQQNL
uniref:Ig-like domain-containing protein n=1 Tax=Ailuropoda melanoleuca TaxID=9646 RepID=A0A7N5JW53_AILME